MISHLFEPVRLGTLDLANRVVVSPMTRDRAGMIVTEGTQPTQAGKG